MYDDFAEERHYCFCKHERSNIVIRFENCTYIFQQIKATFSQIVSYNHSTSVMLNKMLKLVTHI